MWRAVRRLVPPEATASRQVPGARSSASPSASGPSATAHAARRRPRARTGAAARRPPAAAAAARTGDRPSALAGRLRGVLGRTRTSGDCSPQIANPAGVSPLASTQPPCRTDDEGRVRGTLEDMPRGLARAVPFLVAERGRSRDPHAARRSHRHRRDLHGDHEIREVDDAGTAHRVTEVYASRPPAHRRRTLRHASRTTRTRAGAWPRIGRPR